MASSLTTKSSYLLPGERNSSSCIVHNHGLHRTLSTTNSKQSSQDAFISIPRIYEPKENDLVIGIVIVRTPDLFLVDINSSESTILLTTSFDEGRLPARNTMNRLSVVYARVIRTDSWTQTELSCQSPDRTKKKSDFGVLSTGHLLRCSLALCEKLQQSQLISHFNRLVKNFRIRVTRNGFIWYITDTTNSMIAIKNVLYEHEFENNIDHLLNRYHILMDKLQQHDDSFVKVKQQKQQPPPLQQLMKKDVEIKKTEPSINKSINSTAVTRLLTQVVQSILDTIISDIEKNEQR